MGDATATEGDETGSYGGLLGAFPYAFRHSKSTVFRVYVVAGGLLAALVAVLFGLGTVVSIANSTGLATGGTSSFVRTFVLLVGFLTVLPLVAPVLLVARRHRRTGGSLAYDRALALAGFGVAIGLYLSLVVSVPESQQEPVTGLLGPVVAALYALPAPLAVLPPLVAAVLVYLAHRRYQ
ncbi:hypothetical protein [Halosegnis sp.]|uniref:hypothetical protein n=1 Tax=Halosegnis sp. TaxID=2864959 RepID=UPI0035D43864